MNDNLKQADVNFPSKLKLHFIAVIHVSYAHAISTRRRLIRVSYCA